MDRQTMQPMVLARIPDIAIAAHHGEHKEHKTVPTSSGRVIGQSLSFKLLAGVVLLLVVVAVIPFALWRQGQSTDAPATADALPTWHLGSPAPSATTAPTWTPVAAVPASAPIPASPSPMPSVVPQANVASQPPASASIDSPLMSAWPNSAHPTAASEVGAEEPRAARIRPWRSVRPSTAGTTVMTALDQAFIKAFTQQGTFPPAVLPQPAAPAAKPALARGADSGDEAVPPEAEDRPENMRVKAEDRPGPERCAVSRGPGRPNPKPSVASPAETAAAPSSARQGGVWAALERSPKAIANLRKPDDRPERLQPQTAEETAVSKVTRGEPSAPCSASRLPASTRFAEPLSASPAAWSLPPAVGEQARPAAPLPTDYPAFAEAGSGASRLLFRRLRSHLRSPCNRSNPGGKWSNLRGRDSAVG